MAALSEAIASEVIDNASTYETLKESILDNLKGNKHELINQALSAMTLGDKIPSQLVTEIKRRFEITGLALDGAIVISRLLFALPPTLDLPLLAIVCWSSTAKLQTAWWQWHRVNHVKSQRV